MKNRLILKLTIICLTLFIYALIFSYVNADKNRRINTITTQQIDKLRTHYNLTTKYFKITSDATVDMINGDKVIIDILTKFIDATPHNQAMFRDQLYNRLLSHYKRIQKQGVLQFHFIMPNSVTSFRMHKPSKFGDDLREFKYSFAYVNETKEPISGLEHGRTAPSFRNVTPLFSEDHKHIGAVDIAFAPEVLQKNLYETNGIYSHFVIKKEVFKKRKWNRNNNKNDYITSVENENYFSYIHHENDMDSVLIPIVNPLKKIIHNKMSKNETFSLFKKDNGIYKIISFLPITNTQNSVIAYLVSYTDSTKLTTMINDFYHVNIIIILSLLIVAFFVYRVVLYNHELRLEKKKFYNLSQYDTLTQLPNRTLFYDRLEESISKATQNKTRFALLLIDIDNFKHLNDSYGHSEGDKILKSVGLKLKKIIPQEDTLARIGGDEFVVIIENINNSLDVNATTNKIINLFKIPINIENKLHYISVSIGISLFDDDSNEISELIKYADIAMYKAKDAGKNNAQFYSPEMTQEVVERVTLENELREAIKNEEFIVHYQPQVNGLNSKLIGMEALVRWQHPTKGLISPIKFIPIAEESGLIIPLDQLVMKIAMKQMSEWYKKGLNPGKLAINLAIKQLQQKNFIEILKDIMSETDCKREWLELEVTEGQIMTNPEQAIKVLNQISDLGIELAIDDFGTGYSSLSYLKKLPINKLKIDQSFVKDLPKDEDDAAIVKAVIALGHSLNLRLIAEGVETKEQKDFLIKNGCNNIQGYFYSKPINAQEMETTLLKEVVSLQK